MNGALLEGIVWEKMIGSKLLNMPESAGYTNHSSCRQQATGQLYFPTLPHLKKTAHAGTKAYAEKDRIVGQRFSEF